jgi:hypothetical protein
MITDVKVSFLAYSKKEGLQLARENDNRRDARIDHSLPIRIEDLEAGLIAEVAWIAEGL